MARAMWTGVISFGMVTIPVRLNTAIQGHNVAFHLLHAKCDTRIKQQRWCPHCEEQVDWDDVVKGFEYSKGEYVELTDEDFEKLPLPSKNTIDLSTFVDENEIDPIFYDSTYYVGVEGKGAQKAYKLLVEVMESKKVAGIASIAFRNREHICAIRVIDGRLHLQTLLYPDEIKENETAKPSAVKISEQEIKMAEHLVAALQGKFEPGEFKDSYEAALKKLIKAKLKGKEVKEPLTSEPSNVTDLMEALQASLESTKAGAHKKTARAASSTPSAAKRVTARRSAAKRSSAPAVGTTRKSSTTKRASRSSSKTKRASKRKTA
jgi:Ku protein, prokaryotic